MRKLTCAILLLVTAACSDTTAPNSNGSKSLTVVALAAGDAHTCASVGADSSSVVTKCWGSNSSGQLGTGDTTAALTPQQINAIGFVQLSAASLHTCGMTSSRKLYCWGDNLHGQLGDGTQVSTSAPRLPVSFDAMSVSASVYRTCAISSLDHSASCWGDNEWGSLATGSAGPDTCTIAVFTHSTAVPCAEHPVSVSGSRQYMRLGGGLDTCGLDMNGAAYCWGLDYRANPAVYDGATTPTPIAAAERFVDVASGRFSCGVTASANVYCWGNVGVPLANGTVIYNSPTLMASGYSSVAVGGTHACALSAAGRATCWGDGFAGQLGNGTTATMQPPTAVAQDTLVFTMIATGGSHTCGATRSAIYCWGSNARGQLGTGDTLPRLTPTRVQW